MAAMFHSAYGMPYQRIQSFKCPWILSQTCCHPVADQERNSIPIKDKRVCHDCIQTASMAHIGADPVIRNIHGRQEIYQAVIFHSVTQKPDNGTCPLFPQSRNAKQSLFQIVMCLCVPKDVRSDLLHHLSAHSALMPDTQLVSTCTASSSFSVHCRALCRRTVPS